MNKKIGTAKNGMLPISDEKVEALTESVSEFSEKALDASKNAVDKSVAFAKDYPVHTAIGAGIAGFIVGILTKKIFK